MNISTGEITGTITFSGFSSNSTDAHIRMGPVGVAGLIIIPLAEGAEGTSGIWSVLAGTILTAARLTALSNNQLYVNVHSANFGDGDISSQLIYPRGPRPFSHSERPVAGRRCATTGLYFFRIPCRVYQGC